MSTWTIALFDETSKRSPGRYAAEFARRGLRLHYIFITGQARPMSTDLREQFPILEQGFYFNHAAIGPWPLCTARAVKAFAEENSRQGPVNYRKWIARETALRNRLADLTGASSPEDIALLKNTTEGISTVAWGIDWEPGDNIVLPEGEFPSNRLPWLAQASRGVEIREVDIRTDGDAESALVGAMDSRTRLLSVSAVQWSDGFRLNLPSLGAACRQRNILFFVDAIQQLGALPIDIESANIDFLAADAHKWLLGPEGIALFYCRASARPLLSLRQQGWHMFENPWLFERKDWTPAESARRFEAGTPNSVGQAGLLASLDLLFEYGVEDVGRRVLANTDFLIGALDNVPGIRLTSQTDPDRRSGIVSFMHESIPTGQLQRSLNLAGVSCAVRGSSIRLSPHFYQGEAELGGFLKVLRQATD